MSYLVLARRWRPQTFADMAGQEHVTRTLQNAIRSGRIAHAFLFAGVRGVGKTTAARILAKALNCADGPTPEPCNACPPCIEITNGQSVDVIEIDGASNTGVDDVRLIIENVKYQPASCRFKIYIIDEVHMLSTSAFNALLKTLEEPPPHVKFIFATTDPHKVPATVQSRCQRYDFRRIPLRVIVHRLADIARAEGVEIQERALFAIAREAEGSMRDAQSFLDQLIASGEQQVRDEDVFAALGITDRRRVLDLAGALLQRDAARCLAVLEDLHARGADLRRLSRELLELVHDLALVQVGVKESVQERWGEEDYQELQSLAGRTSIEELNRIFRGLVPLDSELARVPFPKTVFEMTLLRLATQEPLQPLGDVLEELRRMEHRLRQPGIEAPSVAPSPRSSPAKSPGKLPVAPPARGSQDTTSQRFPEQAGTGTATTASATLAESTSVPPMEEPSWAAFLRFVEERKPILASHMEACPPAQIASEVLSLTVPNGHHAEYLEQAQNRAVLEQLAAEFYGRPLKLQLKRGSEAGAQNAGATLRKARQSALDHPLVRAAVEILGAQVQEVRPRPKG